MIRLIYEGADITDSVSVRHCWHDMHAGGRSDTLLIRLNDASNYWDLWQPKNGDEIRVDFDTASTGAMFVTSTETKNGAFTIQAMSAPRSGFVPQFKAWQQVRFMQIGREIAERNSLDFESYGVTDHLYSYILQSAEGDFAFLNRLATLEGCAFIVYDKRLIIYNEAYIESAAPAETLHLSIDGDNNYTDRTSELYGSCIVENGLYSGMFAAQNGSVRVYRPQDIGGIGSNDDAERFAKGLLRAANKACRSGYVYAPILPGYAPGSMLDLQTDRAPSWDGAVFVDRIRNDYVKKSAKIWFRKPLEGY